ncbi:MAG: hypothetical protein MUF42_06680 [Cytophagaceae bacterium]|jgi:uncharacterized coiled-coil DUF342 family protein|nr:hypothetical protein [Cytophagaceae bacterium]
MKSLFVILFVVKISIACADPFVASGDTANSEYLKGQARQKKENLMSLVKKAEELKTMYEGYRAQAKPCAGARPQWQKAMKLSQRALKKSHKGLKLAEKAEKATTMKKAKKYLSGIDDLQLSAREDCILSEERKKEIDFEIRGCK